MFHLKTNRGLFSFTAESAPDFVIAQKKGGESAVIMYKYHPGEAKFTIFEGSKDECLATVDAIYKSIGNNNTWINLTD